MPEGEDESKVPPRPGDRRAPVPQRPATPRRPPANRARQRLTARQLAQRRKANLYLIGGISAVVVVIVGGIIALSVTGGGGGHEPSTGSGGGKAPSSSSAPARRTTTTNPEHPQGTFAVSPALQAQVAGVPAATLVSAASTSNGSAVAPQVLPLSAPKLTSRGKPEILYIGAEWCPFCAAERWPLVMALAKFGTFGPLQGTGSSSSDEFADTPTFSFYHRSYTSKYLAFVPVEEQTRTYAPLQRPTASQQALMSRYDVPPYVSEAGSIPFIYIGGKYLLIGAQYSADAIAGRSFSSTVPYMTSGTNATSKGAEAAAGLLVASICDLTYGQPASVCSQVPPSLLAKTKS